MRLYLSGVAGPAEADMLRAASDFGPAVRYVLADPTDWPNVAEGATGADWGLALDSGAYRAWKRGGGALDIPGYLRLAGSLCASPDSSTRPDFCVAPDIIGDPERTRADWLAIPAGLRVACRLAPVWHWGADDALLSAYLDECPPGVPVCVGALVPAMRARDRGMLRSLRALCSRQPGRLHLLGANWVEALEAVAPLAASADTSKWLDGARYGNLLVPDAGRLRELPARLAAGLLPHRPDLAGCESWDRPRRCAFNAGAMSGTFGGRPASGRRGERPKSPPWPSGTPTRRRSPVNRGIRWTVE